MECCYGIAGKYRQFKRNHGLLDASYDVELGPVRKRADGSVISGSGGKSRKNRELTVGESDLPGVVAQRKQFCTNRIKTTKYTVISFIPIFLFEQFRKAANVFFLIVSLLQVIPGVSPTGKFTTSGPLTVILTLTAFKEIYEDYKRFTQDKLLNGKLVEVLTRSAHGSLSWVKSEWHSVRVGNIVRVTSTQSKDLPRNKQSSPDIPADLVILATSELDTGTCTITTKNLDGETNLKVKNAVGHTHSKYNNSGDKTTRAGSGRTELIGSQEAESNFTSVVNGHSGAQPDSGISSAAGLSNDVSGGGSEAAAMAYVADGCLGITCERPHKNMEVFQGQLRDSKADVEGEDCLLPLTIDNLLLRECRLENTRWVVGAVVYTGPEAKISLNSKKPPLKQSSIERLTNTQIYIIFGIMLVMAGTCLAGSLIWQNKHTEETNWYIPPADATSVASNDVLQVLLDYATFFILFNNLVPISLLVSIEFVKLAQAYFIDNDPQMKFDDISANARTSNLNEELGRVKHVFSDKTGTLTQNRMVFKRCFVAGRAYDTDADLEPMDRAMVKRVVADNTQKDGKALDEFLTMMAVCNTVQPNEGAHLGFIASSPDEHALAVGARSLGFTLKSRGADSIEVEGPAGDVRTIVPKHVVPFDSDRKRMSLIYTTSQETTRIFTKGADTTMRPLLSKQDEEEFLRNVETTLLNYSREGLRTLVFASRDLTPEESASLTEILLKLSDPATSPEMQTVLERDYDAIIGKLEAGLGLVGCSAVEDKLQDGVPDCIAKLREAEMNVWMLTGDKLETANEIALSCRLFDPPDTGFVIHQLHVQTEGAEDNVEAMRNKLRAAMRDIVTDVNKKNTVGHGLIFEGKVLKQLALSPKELDVSKELYEFSKLFKSVAACRLEPLQKADLVEMTKTLAKNEITLAIGDGANDVPMIQAAHVGVGIQGYEGLQAVLSSDYSIAQFRFLLRLLLIHGHFSYLRVSNTILYSFYKNMTLYLINLYYQFVAGFTGQPCFERNTLTLFNIAFTSFPLFTLGILDRPVSEQQMLNNVKLYRTSQNSLKFNAKIFWTWALNAVLHSLVIFLSIYLATGGDITLHSSHAIGVFSFGETIYTAVVLVVTIKLVMITNTFYTVTILLVLITGIASWFSWMTLSSLVAAYLPTTYGFIQTLGGSMWYWSAWLFAVVFALYRDLLYKGLKTNLWPSLADQVRAGLTLDQSEERSVSRGSGTHSTRFVRVDDDGGLDGVDTEAGALGGSSQVNGNEGARLI